MGVRAMNIWMKHNQDREFYVQYYAPDGTHSVFTSRPLRFRTSGVSLEAEIERYGWVSVWRLYQL